MRKTEIIQRLNELDLRCCEDRDIIELIDNNSYALQFINISPGQVVYRATVLSDTEKIESVDTRRLSYKLAEDNHKYQRASTPGHTMFYGIMPNMEEQDYVKSGIAAAFFETSDFFRDKNRSKEWRIHVVSEWQNIRPLSLLVIANPTIHNKSDRLNDSAEGYRAYVEACILEEFAEEEIQFQDFLYGRFSTHYNDEYEYKISALFSKKFLEEAKKKGVQIDGIVWQSAINIDDKLNDCLCVAILPETIDNSFQAPNHFYYIEEYNPTIKLKKEYLKEFSTHKEEN